MAFVVVRQKSYGLDSSYRGPETKAVFMFETFELPGVTPLIQLGIESSSLIPVGVFDNYLRMTIEEDDSPFFHRNYRVTIWLAGTSEERTGSIPVGGGGIFGIDDDLYTYSGVGGAIGLAPLAIVAIGAAIAIVAVAVISSATIGYAIIKSAAKSANMFFIAGAVVALGLGSLAIVLAFKKQGQASPPPPSRRGGGFLSNFQG